MTVSGDDWTDVADVAGAYYRAMYEGDEAVLRQIFDHRAPVVGTMDGSFMWMSLDDFVQETRDSVGKHGEAESRIDSLQVIGDIATVTVGGRYWQRWFTDQLAMVRTDDGWRIQAKTFHAHPAEG